MEDAVWKICYVVWKGEEWIEEWSKKVIVPIRKKGKRKKVEDYKGVTIMPSLYKVYATVVTGRLKKEVEEGNKVSQNQMGFRKGMGTNDNVYVLNYFVKRQLSKKRGKLVAFFVDVKAAFDSVNRGGLGKAMKDRGISERLVRKCEEIIRETRNRVKIRGKVSDVFCTGREVRQGCPLNPGLFNLVMADLEEEMRKGVWGGIKLG